MDPRAPDLDLHAYIRDTDKARAILDACIADNLKNGRSLVRVVHGKGKGDFRKIIHSYLEKHPDVAGYVLCDPRHGGEGATWAHIGTSEVDPDELPDEDIQSDEISSDELKEKPPRPWWRWIAYVVFLLAAFAVFPQAYMRAIMVVFIFWFELRQATADN
jgi:hypothetical protein